MTDKDRYTYTRHGGVWYLYDGPQVIRDDPHLFKLLAWARDRGITPTADPVRIAYYGPAPAGEGKGDD